MFDVAGWVPLLGEDVMVETEPQDDESRVALRIDRGACVYGDTRKLPRWVYPDWLPSHDLNQPRADRYGLSKNQKRTAERALRRSIVGTGLHGTISPSCFGRVSDLRKRDVSSTLWVAWRTSYARTPSTSYKALKRSRIIGVR